VNRTIVTLTAVVALTLGACTSNNGWSDEAFRDLMTYCQAEVPNSSDCATLIIMIRDGGECSVEATYRIIDAITANPDDRDDRVEAFTDLVKDVLVPAGDCLGLDE